MARPITPRQSCRMTAASTVVHMVTLRSLDQLKAACNLFVVGLINTFVLAAIYDGVPFSEHKCLPLFVRVFMFGNSGLHFPLGPNDHSVCRGRLHCAGSVCRGFVGLSHNTYALIAATSHRRIIETCRKIIIVRG